MITIEKTAVTVVTCINAPIEKVWKFWTEPEHIVNWNNASDDWHTPRAHNDLRPGGRFICRMEAKDGSQGFDFSGTYNHVEPLKQLDYTIDDGRKVQVLFISEGYTTTISEIFEAETTHPIELQHSGWQSILDNFKRYVERSGKFEPMHFEININASAEKVYNTILDERYFTEWTRPFNPASYFKGSWEKGSKMLFLGTDQHGNLEGMIGKIRENIPNEYVSIEYIGVVKDVREITTGPETEGWAGAFENYTFNEENGRTKLSVYIDANKHFVPFFSETWPKALASLKMICES